MSGSVCLLISTLFFTLMGVSVKFLQSIPFYEIVFFRSIISLGISFGVLRVQSVPFMGNDKKLLLWRGLTGAISLLLYFLTIQQLPFAIAVTVQYLSPLFTVLISGILLKEALSVAQSVCLVVGFFSIFLVQNVQVIEVSIFVLLGVISALLSALSYTSIRVLNKSEHPLVIVLYFAVVTLVLVTPLTCMYWTTPSGREFGVLLLMGVAAQGAQYFLTLAYQREKAALVSSLTYLNVVWAILVSRILWDEYLNLKNILGITLIILCSILSNHRSFKLSVLKGNPSSS